MHILIVGGSGFIGSYLIKYLISSNDYTFQVLDKNLSSIKGIDFLHINFLNIPDFSLIKKPDIIINLAAEHSDNISPVDLYYKTNVDGAKIICDIADYFNCKRILFTSSVAVYGFVEPNANEDTLPKPFSHYGKSKLIAESKYQNWYRLDDQRDLIIIRPTVVFGPGNRGNFYNLVSSISKGRFLMIGNGENSKSIAYVENLVNFIIYSLNSFSGYKLIVYVDKPDYKMINLVNLIHEQLKVSYKFPKIPYLMGLFVGFLFDIFSFIFRRKFIISRLRVIKFTSQSTFSSRVLSTINFKPPFLLNDAIIKTIKTDFNL
jgi:GlcNAc-P-P-Und epimerase